MTPEVRSDDGKAPSFSPARPCVSPSWLSAGRRRPNFVAVRLAETENRSQPTWNPGDVGLISVIRGISIVGIWVVGIWVAVKVGATPAPATTPTATTPATTPTATTP